VFDVAQAAVEGALAAGASYADARARVDRIESLEALNQVVEGVRLDETSGVGVRALIGSSWGFFAASDLNETAARRAGEQAADIARASASVPGPPLELADVAIADDHYQTPYDEHPFDVSLAEKGDLLVGVTRSMQEVDNVHLARCELTFWDTQQWFVSSQGHRISQHLVKAGGGMDATAVGEAETQRRSYPQSFGHFETGGYEVVRRMDMPRHAGRVADEAVALLSAPECPATVTDLVLESSQVALQIHESVGHAIELDRILGWEAAFAGTSWLELDKLGTLRFGSNLMNITADATLPGALGTFGYDDEGTPAQSVDITREGIWVGVLSGRDSAALAGLPPGGMVRADGFGRLPMVRMTNVGLLPGEHSTQDIVAATDDGIYMATNRSWSIDDKRLNFQFGCEAAWEIKRGKLGRLLRNPTYTGIGPQFWASLDMLGGEDEWTYWGLPNCGKGQPLQTAHTAHPAVPARFRNVRVGVRG
jgi:TldD protein